MGKIATPKFAGRSGRKWRTVVTWLKDNRPWICHSCGGEIPKDVDHQRDVNGYTVDHVYPLVRILAEGLDPYDKDNLVPMHRRCNSEKGSSVVGEAQPVKVSRQW